MLTHDIDSGRMLMETDELPVIIPMWLAGALYMFSSLHDMHVDGQLQLLLIQDLTR